ncbi:mpv17-like protein isoform X2 [Eupeodes corollae]|uniref:mpv17-like protein isoform X2 n=1 Tax=Eupeodes corollae TaxID=290404 RepID=UPI0024932213|nr:mpv17-like protein isoform X2 [Eupeodes corollae]
MFHQIRTLSNKWKIIRGMISYGIIWPCASLIEQTLVEKKTFKNYDWMKCLRFSLFGAFFMGPSLYVWFRLAEIMWPKRSLKTTLCKVCTESTSYDPMSITTFLFTMSLMEGKSYEEAKNEVKTKFFETYKVGLMSWPLIQYDMDIISGLQNTPKNPKP